MGPLYQDVFAVFKLAGSWPRWVLAFDVLELLKVLDGLFGVLLRQIELAQVEDRWTVVGFQSQSGLVVLLSYEGLAQLVVA